MKTSTIGLVLSGGGYRGIAHAGAIKAFEEAGIFPNHISGTSAGALVGALYAAEHSPEEILSFFKKAYKKYERIILLDLHSSSPKMRSLDFYKLYYFIKAIETKYING